MAYCSKCGTQLSEGANFCPKCGNPCTSDNVATEESRSTFKKPLSITLAVLIVLALLGGGWYFWDNLTKDYSLEGLAKAVVNYDIVGDFHDGRAHVIKFDGDPDNMDWKYGYIDKKGNEIIPCKYVGDEMTDYDFHEGIAAVFNGEKYVYIDVDGNEISPTYYNEAGSFSEGYAIAYRDETYYIINNTGEELVKLKYKPIIEEAFSEGLFPVWGDDYNMYGFINVNGELIIPCKYVITDGGAGFFKEGYAAVYNGDKYGYIDKSGKEVIPFIYDEALSFSEGLAPVDKEGEWFYINTDGQKVLNTNETYDSGFSDGVAVGRSEDGNTYYYMDKTGKNAFNRQFDSAHPFIDGYARVGKKTGNDYLWGFIDKTGKEIIPCEYKDIYTFSEGLAAVKKDGINGYVGKDGKSTFDYLTEETIKKIKRKIKLEEEARKKKEEEERRKWEEENKPVNRFISFINQNSFVWEAPNANRLIVALYFYPISNSVGKISLVSFGETFETYSERWSGNGTYKIIDDVVEFEVTYKYWDFWVSEAVPVEKTLLRIENNGDKVMLVDVRTDQTFIQKRNHIDNPIKGMK